MACYACGVPGEADAHHGDCWFAYLHGRNRAEAKRFLDSWAEKVQENERLLALVEQQAAELARLRNDVEAWQTEALEGRVVLRCWADKCGALEAELLAALAEEPRHAP